MTKVTMLRNDTDQPISLPNLADKRDGRKLQSPPPTFLSHVVHELCTPIASLKIRLQLVRKQPERLDEHLKMMETTTANLQQLVNDILDLTRLNSGVISLNKQEIVLQDLILSVLEMVRPTADAKRIALLNTLPIEPLPILVDPERIAQTITNLVANAINYTPEAGTVTIQLISQGSSVIIQVRDTGPGITQENLTRIFEPFVRVAAGSAKGTGLGLTIAKQIVEAHHGRITVESEIGCGCMFSIHLARR